MCAELKLATIPGKLVLMRSSDRMVPRSLSRRTIRSRSYCPLGPGRGGAVLIFALSAMFAAGLADAAPANGPGEAVLSVDGRVVADSSQVSGEFRFASPQALIALRENDDAAKSAAIEWYAQQLMARAAEDDGLSKKLVGLESAAKARARQFLAAQYFDDYLSREHEPSESELKQYYAMEHGLCTTPERVRVSKLEVVVAKRASDAEKQGALQRQAAVDRRLGAGEEFGVVADELSDSSGVGPGGDLGWSGSKELAEKTGVPELLDLKVGETKRIGDPATGFRTFKVIDRKPAGRLSFEACRDEIRREISQRFRREASLRLVDELARRFQASFNADAFVAAVRAVEPLKPSSPDPSDR